MINNSKQPIGIFDSGIGGTSIWKEIQQLLPNEDTIYLADSLNAPYGQKTKEEIINLSIKNTEFLIQRNCKLIVVACNTATTNAIQYLRENYSVPFIGIEPAIKPASLQTKTKTIGILATKGTLNSELFEKTSSLINNDIKIIEQIGEGLVELIEQGKIDSSEMNLLLKSYIDPMLKENIDCLVLGCTHYPYLINAIRKITNTTLTIIDSGEAVARQTKRILVQKNLLNTEIKNTSNIFYTNKNKIVLERILEGAKYSSIEQLAF
ncbi:glutamate racemase [Tenacibaculum jejuense]|uniref:Glutamate racemase n=1 Tax=Tenacibaculum jejuense TaxID=584609 RepID=A0A238U5N4_9FLAO|nr:glutamate racemase [Tenacibaculum jejuense]SNR14513.1 Glutamate racemase [Tenacibaculum jejuense]